LAYFIENSAARARPGRMFTATTAEAAAAPPAIKVLRDMRLILFPPLPADLPVRLVIGDL
jgi:hypothetical protein